MLRDLTGCLRAVTVHIIAFRASGGGALAYRIEDVLCGMNGKLQLPCGIAILLVPAFLADQRSPPGVRRCARDTPLIRDAGRSRSFWTSGREPDPVRTALARLRRPSQNAKIRLTFRTMISDPESQRQKSKTQSATPREATAGPGTTPQLCTEGSDGFCCSTRLAGSRGQGSKRGQAARGARSAATAARYSSSQGCLPLWLRSLFASSATA